MVIELDKKKAKDVMKRVGGGALIAVAVLLAMMRLNWLKDIAVGVLALVAVPLLLLLGFLFPDLYIDLS